MLALLCTVMNKFEQESHKRSSKWTNLFSSLDSKGPR